ncbi:Phosphatidylinositol N-acetylglucosaminyltransferase gpi3 subunit [Hondaea fermentalgiana]|uniref:Phosphatidylinositol N-acetylglucosaminyltransferase gpi3 subunit n=1 Tax=Hondaea fermentalgiana TaxID=2315210 RepID=A0A2R5G4M6_9STRA|nr:Phosphatidylinositol N-acetylglucosaminyltransferase gpi3 subunit [Hondaea fermentalgiana]|eukprot:GBG25940.1 Phosphatidylinositol N-acetylglucosaminyltransferase gpi3 subunit [Hondaea fermentalgiana]
MAILEAACCGLLVISTRVGGIPEVLPPDMITFASEPSAQALVACIEDAILQDKLSRLNPQRFHERVKDMYTWPDVAERVSRVYDRIKEREPPTLEARLVNSLKRSFEMFECSFIFAAAGMDPGDEILR